MKSSCFGFFGLAVLITGVSCNNVPGGDGEVGDAGVSVGVSSNALSSPPDPQCAVATFQGHEYWFCRQLRTWSAARTRCQSQPGMDLARIDSPTENAFIFNNTPIDAWIGASDTATEGAWRWSDNNEQFWSGAAGGGTVASRYANWKSGQPDNWFNQDCAAMELFASGKWADRACTETLEFVCERALATGEDEVGCALTGALEDAPWPGFRRCPTHQGMSPLVGAQDADPILTYETDGDVESSPAIAEDGTVYVGSYDGYLYALNPDMSLKWRYQTLGMIRSSPAIAPDGTIHVGSNDGRVYAIRPNGTLKWSYQTLSPVRASPAVASDGRVYVGSDNSRFYALSSTGTRLWDIDTLAAVRSSAAISPDGTIYVGFEDWQIVALNPTGTQKWAYPTLGPVTSSPVIGPDGTVYVGCFDGFLYAIHPGSGTLKWSYNVGSPITSSPAVTSDGVIVFGSDDAFVRALNPNGTLKWSYETGGIIISSPAIGADGTVYVGSRDAFIYALDVDDGSVVWTLGTDGEVESSPAIGADGKLYVGSDDDKLYAIGPDCNPATPCSNGQGPCISDDGCEPGLTCGYGDGPRYGSPQDVRVCWNPDLIGESGPCSSNDQCAAGLECRSDVAWRFGITGSDGVCWNPGCANPPSTLYPCGSIHARCGLCDAGSCTPDCSFRSCGDDGCYGTCGQECDEGEGGCNDNDDCSGDLHCGVDNGARFGLPSDVRVCWQISCEAIDQVGIPCGNFNSTCGTCPECSADCSHRLCGSDTCGGSCGTCGGAESSCVEPSGQCVANASTQFPLPADAQVTTQPVGTLPGDFQVTLNGDASYRIPIGMPPGINGMAPPLALRYDSSQSDGYLGIGWSMEGFSSIQRCPGTVAQDDGTAFPVMYNPFDRLCLDGRRLVLVGQRDVDGHLILEFRTETETFTKVEGRYRRGSSLADLQGPFDFVAYTKDGRVMEYGTNENSRIMGHPSLNPDGPSGAPDIHLWLLTEVRNRAGNAYRIRYVDHSLDVNFGRVREVYPEAIYYGGHEEGRDPFVVSFGYEDRGAPGLSGWRDGVNVQTNKLLTRISVHVRGARHQMHLLEYEGGGGGLDGARKRLVSAQLCTDAMVCQPPTRFEYDVPEATLGLGVELAGTAAFFRNDRSLDGSMPRFVLDLNGDGIDDLLYPIYADGEDFVDFIYTPERWINWWAVISNRTPTGTIERTTVDTGQRIAFAEGGSPLLTAILLATPFGRVCEPSVGGQPVGGDLCPIPGDFASNSAGGVIDWNNDGRQELIEYGQGDELVVLMHDGTRMQRFATGIERDAGDVPHVADVNGDGLDDLLVCNIPITCYYGMGRAPQCRDQGGPTSLRVYLNDGGAGGFWYPSQPQMGTVGLHAATMREVQTDLDCRHLTTMDVDGDRTEEALVDLEGVGTIVVDIFANSGSDSAWVAYQHSGARGLGMMKGDVNGDGLTDLIAIPVDREAQTIHLEVDINRGDGFFSRADTIAPYPVGDSWYSSLARQAFVWDENVDGKQDLLVPHPNGTWLVYRGSANGLEQARELGIALGPAATPADMNGDGVQDIVHRVSNRMEVRSIEGPSHDLLISVTNGLGARTSIAYGNSSTSVYNHASFSATEILCRYPHDCTRPRKMLVREHRVFDEASDPVIPLASQVYSYTYGGGRSHASGRGWLGFAAMQVERREASVLRSRQTLTFDNATHLADRTFYPFAGLVKSAHTETFVPSSIPGAPDEIWISDTTNTYDIAYATPLSVYAPLARVDASRYVLDNGTVRPISQSAIVVQERDAFGNSTRVTQDFGIGEIQTVERVFKHAEDPSFVSNWLVGLPSEDHVTSTMHVGAGAGSMTRFIDYDYDSRGFLTEAVREPGDPLLERTTTIVRAADGLVEAVEERDIFGDERAVSFSYRAGERHFPERITNAVGHETTVAFDERFGVPVGVLDPNNLLTLIGYDDFGRRGVVLRPDGSRSWTTYEPGTDADHPMIVDSFEVGGERARVELDVLGRASRIRSWGLGNQELTSHVTYDDNGLVASRSRPSASNAYFERFKYDALGRVVEHTGLRNEVSRQCYVGSTSCTQDPRGNTRCTVPDRQGRPLRITAAALQQCRAAAEAASTAPATTYAYGPFGFVHELRDRVGNPTVVSHDAYGRKLGLHDPDLGNETYWYNGFDELVRSVDGRGTVTELDYDTLGRLRLRRHRDQFGPGIHGESIYEWDGGTSLGADELLGALTRTVSADGAEQRFSFDGSSGLLSRIRTVTDGMTFDVDYDYDDFARVERITYPQGPSSSERIAVRNVYDTYGHVMGLADANAPATQPLHWAITNTTQEGEIRTEQYGNGTGTVRYYYRDGRALEIAHHLGGQRFQAYEYEYDPSGNLQSRTDTIRSQAETFLYDEHDRLRLTTDTGLQWFEYDDVGNIHPDSVDAVYRYDSARPHALTSDGVHAYVYDGAGNREARIGPDFTDRYSYTPFNKLRSIEHEPLGSPEVVVAELKYDAFDQRVSQINQSGVTHYANELYERRAREGAPVEHVFYIAAPDRIVAQIVWREGSAAGISYLHDDQLGSTTSITPQAMSTISDDFIERGYRAFGERFTPFDWSAPEPPVLADGQFTREYTGHESDVLSGLINMRGRMYDPSTRQFLSPDPFVQMPMGEGLNRYSYVWNNPLRFIDPSGFQAVHNFDVGTTVTVQSYNFEPTLIVSGVASVQSNAATGPSASPGLSADTGHYQHLTPSGSTGLVWGSSFEPSNLTAASEANPKFKEWGELGRAYLFLPIEILDWACLDGQCGPGAPTAAIGTVKYMAKKEALEKASRALPRIMGGANREMLGQAIGHVRGLQGTAAQKAELFQQLAGQITELSKGSWTAARAVGTEGSHVFLGSAGEALVINPAGQLFRGSLQTGGLHLAEPGKYLLDFTRLNPL